MEVGQKVVINGVNLSQRKGDLDISYVVDNYGCAFKVLNVQDTKVQIDLKGSRGFIWLFEDEYEKIDLGHMFWDDFLWG